MSEPLSSRAFNQYGDDAALYNGIRDLEEQLRQSQEALERYKAQAKLDGEAYLVVVSHLRQSQEVSKALVAEIRKRECSCSGDSGAFSFRCSRCKAIALAERPDAEVDTDKGLTTCELADLLPKVAKPDALASVEVKEKV